MSPPRKARRSLSNHRGLRTAIRSLAFGDVEMREGVAERVATSGDERVVVGRVFRGSTSVTYLLASRVPIEVDDVVAAYLTEVCSPFEYLLE